MNRKKIMEIDNTNIYEDISFKLFTNGENSDNEFIELMFVTNPSKIYRTSDYKKVLHPPRDILLKLNTETLIILSSCLINSICSQLNNQEDMRDIENSFITDNNLEIKMRIPKNNEKEKILIEIFHSNEQIISFSLNKTKVLLLLMMLKDTMEKLDFNKLKAIVNSGVFLFSVIRKNNKIGMNNIWLRNSELEILKFLIHSFIFDYKFKKRFDEYKSMHRQIFAYKNTATNKFVVIIKKYDDEDAVRFSINSKICATFYLFIPIENSFKGDYINEY